jgi:hypothetical protein
VTEKLIFHVVEKPSPHMVSSPVTDLLNESTADSSHEDDFEQENTLENEEGKVLEIHRFLENGVKMVSVNGYTLPLETLLEMIGFDEEAEAEVQDHTVDNYLFAIFVLYMALCSTFLFFALIRV